MTMGVVQVDIWFKQYKRNIFANKSTNKRGCSENSKLIIIPLHDNLFKLHKIYSRKKSWYILRRRKVCFQIFLQKLWTTKIIKQVILVMEVPTSSSELASLILCSAPVGSSRRRRIFRSSMRGDAWGERELGWIM